MNLNLELFDEQWRNRHDAAQLAALAAALDEALAAHPDEYALLWRRARLSHFQAMQAGEAGEGADVQTAEAKAAALPFFAAGAQGGLRAVQAQPHEVEGHFWYGVNLIEEARGKGALAAARALPVATKHIERTAQMDESYHFAGPLRVLGRITHLKPLLLGGSIDRALTFFERGLQLAPHNSTTQLYYAEALLADQQLRKARHVLNDMVAAPTDEEWVWEQERDRRLARALLKKMA